MHPAFQNAGKKEGIELWRIVSFEPVPVDPKEYGKFYSGDSYILLATKEDKKAKTFTWDIHFWLGKSTSQDESGAAAILSVELDDSLGGGPVQHRETEEHESQQFLSYFKSGVRYVPGGAASGFHHVTTNAAGQKALYQVKGKRNIRVSQVEFSVKSMNKGDCFLLDDGRDIYVYVGNKAKRTERLKAISAANQIRDQDHAGRGKVNIIDESSSNDEVKEFFTKLGSGSPSEIKEESAGGDDEAFEKSLEASVTLYQVSDASGKLESKEVGKHPLRRDMLKTGDVFILDTKSSGIYVWVGKGSTTQEKVEALKLGQSFLKTKGYPAWTSMQRIVEKAEPSTFKEYFSEWRDEQLMGGIGGRGSPSRRTRSAYKKCGNLPYFMPDQGNGDIEVFRYEDSNISPLGDDYEGTFFSGQSYVIKYSYDDDGERKYVIYAWNGKDSRSEDKEGSMQYALSLSRELGSNAINMQVFEENEPAHFYKIFKGKMIVLQGSQTEDFGRSSADAQINRLFQVRGSCSDDTRAIQTSLVSSSLNSNDAFLLEVPSKCFLWLGSSCNEEERAMAVSLKDTLCPGKDLELVNEGAEPADFWESLGGEGDYTREASFGTDFNPRLIHCHYDNNRFKTEEIFNFEQKDLAQDDVMLLEGPDAIYVWVGNNATPEEKRMGLKTALAYTSMKGNANKLIISIAQGTEPRDFKEYFSEWNDDLFSNPDYDLINEIED